MKYIAKVGMTYQGRRLVAGDELEPTRQDARLLSALGRIVPAHEAESDGEDEPKPAKKKAKKRAYKRRDMKAED